VVDTTLFPRPRAVEAGIFAAHSMFARFRDRAVINETRSFGAFRLDLSRACLLSNGEEVKLRPKSYEVLRFLVDNPGRVVTKKELTEAIWPDAFVTDDSLVQCIRDIRRALADDPPRVIKTVARRGYIFESEVVTNASKKIVNLNDVTEEPSRNEPGSLKIVRPGSWRHIKPVSIALMSLLVLTVAFVLVRLHRPSPAKPASTSTFPKVNSIAVLPFKVLNPESKDDYLGLGMADTLITRLSVLNQFSVRPTSAIQRYTNTDQDSLAAGREQKVDAVLEGSIQRSADKVRVTVRLLNVQDGRTLWGYKCDEYCADVFEMQDMISATVASALTIRLTADQSERLSRHYTDNSEAYQLYLKGVFLRNQMTPESLKKSVESFQKAIEIDPHYALAYAGEACSYDALTYRGVVPVKEGESKSKELGRRALELDDSLAEAHSAAAERELFIEWHLAAAEKEFKRALELNPNEELANLMYPHLLLMQGRVDQAIAVCKGALDLDPLSPRTNKGLALLLYEAGRYDEAIDQFKKTEELFPNYQLINMGPSYEKKGMFDEAVKEYLAAESRWGLPDSYIQTLKQTYAAAGWTAYWKKRLEFATAKEKHVPAFVFASYYVHLKDNDAAFAWLRKGLEQHEPELITLPVDPIWESLRSDPRFAQLIRQIGLPA